MSSLPDTLFLISYDNGESHEDHRRCPEVITAGKEEAERIVAKVTKWIERQKTALPPCAYEENCARADRGESEMEDAEYGAMVDARLGFLNALKPPCKMDADNMREIVEGGYGRLQITEIPFIAK